MHPGRRAAIAADEVKAITGAGSGVVAWARRVWRALTSLAELLSDAGHGPLRWRERSDEPNPYAGIGPVPLDDRRDATR